MFDAGHQKNTESAHSAEKGENMIDFQVSATKQNLMRAFAGESQARNRYTFAADQAHAEKLYCVEWLFKFTAGQEKEHAEIFYDHLTSCQGKNIDICAGYPIDVTKDSLSLLYSSHKNEYEEYESIYKEFGDKAKSEGYLAVADSFYKIANIEKTHGDRFKLLADLLDKGKLFLSDTECGWICLNCGYEMRGTQAPEMCPVCKHEKGYFIRAEMMFMNV